jgi:DNA invertase Pin-like site-specific DNA recombinase
MALLDVFNEDYTGTTIDRPVFNRLLELADGGLVDAVIVQHPDRLGRGPIIELAIALLAKRGVAVHACNRGLLSDEEDENAQIQNSVDGLVSGIERRNIRRRCTRGLIEKAKVKGKLPGYGSPPYGYRWEGSHATRVLVLYEEEARIVRLIFLWYAEGVTVREICLRLEAMGIPSPSVSTPQRTRAKKASPYKWIGPTIYGILRRHTYMGEFHVFTTRPGKNVKKRLSAEPVIVPVPAIISRDLFAVVQEKLDAGSRLARRNGRFPYLLRCLMKCACGKTMCGSGSGRWYRCSGAGNKHDMLSACDTPVFKRAAVEATVWNWIVEHALDEERLMAALEEQTRDSEAERTRLTDERDYYSGRLATLDGEIARLKTLYLSGLFTLKEITADKRRLDEQRGVIEQHLADVDSRLSALIHTVEQKEQLRTYAQHLRDRARIVTDEQRRELLELLQTEGLLYYTVEGQARVRITVRFTAQEEDLAIESVLL